MRARRTRLVAALAASVALVLSACGGGGGEDQLSGPSVDVEVDQDAQFEPGTTMAELNQRGTIRIDTKYDQPLFGVRGLDGQMQGFEVEIGRIIAGKLGIPPDRIQWVETPSQTPEEVLEKDNADIKADDNTITGPESLRPTGAKVCSVTGSTPAEEIKKYVDPANLVLFDVYSKCADALRTGQVQAVTTDNVILLGLAEQSGGRFKLV